MKRSSQEVDILRLTAGRTIERKKLKDQVIKELPLTIFVNELEIGILLCTPPGLKQLAVGFLLSQGILQNVDRNRIKEIYLNSQKSFVQVHTDIATETLTELTSRRLIASSCGECSFYHTPHLGNPAPLNTSFQVKRETLFRAMREFEGKSTLFTRTGGNHSCALYQADRLKVFAEDLGRHNALDKVLGECFIRGIEPRDKFLLTSGRISWEILVKAAKRAVTFLASPSAPTDLAVSWATRLNITLVGFLRQGRMNIYSHPDRVA